MMRKVQIFQGWHSFKLVRNPLRKIDRAVYRGGRMGRPPPVEENFHEKFLQIILKVMLNSTFVKNNEVIC